MTVQPSTAQSHAFSQKCSCGGLVCSVQVFHKSHYRILGECISCKKIQHRTIRGQNISLTVLEDSCKGLKLVRLEDVVEKFLESLEALDK